MQINQSLSAVQEQLESRSSITTTQAGSKPSAIPTASDAAFVNRIFAQLQAIFPAWRSAFPDDRSAAEAKRQWTLGLVEAGLTDVETIKAGLRMARQADSPFIPSVGQFIAWCREAKKIQMDLPPEHRVLSNIIRYSSNRKYPPSDPRFMTQLHPMEYWIYQNIDMYRLQELSQEKAETMLQPVYQEALTRAMAGFQFPEPPLLLTEAPPNNAPRTEEQRERARSAIADLKKTVWNES